MKKSKNHETTNLETLTKQHNIMLNITLILLVIFLLMFLSIFLLGIFVSNYHNLFFKLYTIGSIFTMISVILFSIFTQKVLKIEREILSIKNENKLDILKENIKNNTIKEHVNIKDKEIITKILSKNIEKVEYIGCIIDKYLLLDIYIQENMFFGTVKIPLKDILNSASKENILEMLQCTEYNISIDNIDDELKTLKIKGKDFYYEGNDLSTADILSILEIK